MSKEKAKIISIVGPTASGKSDFAVWLAKKVHGEIISTDSRQVYRGLDIGTGKITQKEMRGVPHHLLDICNPKKIFTVDDFKTEALKKITDIHSRNKTPILCGGTGFYNDVVIYNTSLPYIPPNPKLRRKLETYSLAQLQKTLLALDKNRYREIDIKNKVRLIRAIEIAKSLGKVPALTSNPLYDTLVIGVMRDPLILKKRIEKRLITRLQMGMIDEVKNLHNKGLSWKRMEMLGLEYRYIARFLQKKISKEQMIDNLKKEIWHYAKRQMTWFKKNKQIIWVEPKDIKTITLIISTFLSNRKGGPCKGLC